MSREAFERLYEELGHACHGILAVNRTGETYFDDSPLTKVNIAYSVFCRQQAIIDGLQESLDMVVAEAQRLDKLACEQIERIAELEAQHRWIPVSERLPEFGDHCLFVMPTSIDEVVAGFVSDERETRFQDSSICDLYGDAIGYDADCITFWKPLKLPAPPKGE